MPIYVIRIPHQKNPMGFISETKDEAMRHISMMYDGLEFEDLDEAVSHDMHAGNWSENPRDLLQWVHSIPHQMIRAEQVVKGML